MCALETVEEGQALLRQRRPNISQPQARLAGPSAILVSYIRSSPTMSTSAILHLLSHQ